MNILSITAKRELQDSHSGEAELCAQGLDLRRDYAEILCNDWQIAKRRGQRSKQLATGSVDPFAVFSRRLSGGNFPAGHESAKMIDAHEIELRQREAHSIDPPFETIQLQTIPIVERIAPKLSGLA